MIRQMREKNATKQEPEWETNRALYFATRFPHWIALQQQTPSNLILSLARPRIMTPNQITNILVKNRVPVPLIHTTCKDISPANLDQWNKETGGRVILDSGAVLGWNNNALLPSLDKYNTKAVSGGVVGNESADDIRYDVATNHILISGSVDIDAAISNLAAHNETYAENGQSKKMIVLSFNKVNVKDLVNDDKIWDGLDRLVAAMTGNNLGCCGLALKYSDMLFMTGRRDLWKRAPVCLWVDDWNLHHSMVVANGAVDPDQHKSWSNMTAILDKLKPWQIIMDEDVISSSYPIIERIGQYSQFFKPDQITGLITEIREKIYKSATAPTTTDATQANTTPQEVANGIEITNAIQYYKTALRYFARIREPLAQPGNNTAPRKNRNSDTVTVKSVGNVSENSGVIIKKTSANEICQDIFHYCCEQIAVGYTFISDVIATRPAARAARVTNDELNNKKMN